MCDSFVGCVVSIDCGDVLGTYQGQVYEIEKNENTVTIIKCFRNGIQCQVPKVTLCASDIRKLQILKNASEADTMPEIRQKHLPVAGKAEFPEGSVAPARASSAELQRASPLSNGSQHVRSHRSKSINENYQGTSPVKTLYTSTVNGNKGQKYKHTDHLHSDFHNQWGNNCNKRVSPQCYDDGIDPVEHRSRSHDRRNHNGSTPRKIDRRYQQHRETEDWFSTPVDSYLDDEFDFEKNLALFDKKAVFKEIENNCDYNNIVNNSNEKKPTKYRHDENVLDSGPVIYRQIKIQGVNGVNVQEYVTDTGLMVPCISHESRTKLMDTAESYGLSKARQLEMIGRSASEMVLQLLGGSHRLGPQNAHQQPVAVVLCGPHIQGAMGVNCARQLAVHNVKVVVFVPNFVKVIKELEDEIQLYDLSGGSRTTYVKELPSGNIDIIINAMDNHENRHLLSGQSWYKSIVEWANQNRATVLALDPPTEGGAIDTKWSLSLGLPLHLSERCGQVYLCDLGIPLQVYHETGITYKSPFVNKFLIPLHTNLK